MRRRRLACCCAGVCRFCSLMSESAQCLSARAAPQRPVDEVALALTSRSMGMLIDNHASLTAAFTAAYGTAGGGVSAKQCDVQAEKSTTDVVRKEYVPKARSTVRALQETLRLKRQAAANPALNPHAADARAQLNARHQAAAVRLQAAARMLSARRNTPRSSPHNRASPVGGSRHRYAPARPSHRV